MTFAAKLAQERRRILNEITALKKRARKISHAIKIVAEVEAGKFERGAKRKVRKMSAAARKAISNAQKARWRAHRATK